MLIGDFCNSVKANARLKFLYRKTIFLKFDNQKAFSDVLDTVSF